jgi:hypothetical protein
MVVYALMSEVKPEPGPAPPSELAGVAPLDDDRQVQEIAYRIALDGSPSYTVQLTIR